MQVDLPAIVRKKEIFFLIGICFLVKLLFAYYYVHLIICNDPAIEHGKFYVYTGDSFSYTGAMENYVKTGNYYFVNLAGEKTFAGRPPHYSIPYYFLRFFFSRGTSLEIVVALQLLLESIAAVAAALFVLKFTGKRLMFYSSLVGFCLSFYYLHYSVIPITDSAAASLFIISYYFLFKFLEKKELMSLLFFGILFSAVVVLRPYWSVFLLVIFFYIVFKARPGLKNFFVYGFSIFLPLVILITPWIIRNQQKFGKIIPFQQDIYAGYGVKEPEIENRKILMLMGEDATVSWDKNAGASYFSINTYQGSNWHIPNHIQRDSVLLHELTKYREGYLAIQRGLLPDSDRITTDLAHRFIDSYKQKFVFRSYLLNPLKRVKLFIVNSGSSVMPFNKNSACYAPWHMGVKILQSLFYWLALILGTFGLLLLSFRNRQYLLLLLPVLYLVIVFPLVLGSAEWRYLLPFFYLHCIGVFYCLDRILFSRQTYTR
jgi:hypothetical protein